jgi:hypothetical protein
MLSALIRGRIAPNGRIAQLVEQLTLNQRVLGSNPSVSTKIPKKFNGLGKNQKPDGA